MAKDDDKAAEVQYVGEQPTKQEPGQDPDEANKTGDGADRFKKHGRTIKGVQPLTDDDIPEAGR